MDKQDMVDAVMSLMSTPRYAVQLEPGVWLARWEGDPGRTCVKENRRLYGSRELAERALAAARRYRSFDGAEIQLVTPEERVL